MSADGFSMKMIVQCYECATNLEFMIVNDASRGNGALFQISVSPCPFCEELRQQPESRWFCGQCFSANDKNELICGFCETPRPTTGAAELAAPSQSSESAQNANPPT